MQGSIEHAAGVGIVCHSFGLHVLWVSKRAAVRVSINMPTAA